MRDTNGKNVQLCPYLASKLADRRGTRFNACAEGGAAAAAAAPVADTNFAFEKIQQLFADYAVLNDVLSVCSSLSLQHLSHPVPARYRGRLRTKVTGRGYVKAIRHACDAVHDA